jgi:hypothetical protein
MFQYPTFIVIAGLLGIAFGLPLLIAPGIVLALNGAQTDTTGLWLARLAGGVLIEAGLTQVLLAPLNDEYVQKRVLMATDELMPYIVFMDMPLIPSKADRYDYRG